MSHLKYCDLRHWKRNLGGIRVLSDSFHFALHAIWRHNNTFFEMVLAHVRKCRHPKSMHLHSYTHFFVHIMEWTKVFMTTLCLTLQLSISNFKAWFAVMQFGHFFLAVEGILKQYHIRCWKFEREGCLGNTSRTWLRPFTGSDLYHTFILVWQSTLYGRCFARPQCGYLVW